MTLNQCTKEELLKLLARLKKQNPSSEWYIERILNDMQYEHDLNLIAQAENWETIAHAARTEYVNLLKPYEGMRLTDIPAEVINRAGELMQTAERADREYNRLMHIRS